MIGRRAKLDIVGLCIIIACTGIFLNGLHIYLSTVPNQWVMMFVLGSSLLIAFVYDLKQGLNRRSFIFVISTSFVFSLAPYLAIEFRSYYLQIVLALQEIPSDQLELNGYHHYVNAVSNPMVGVGACFGFGLGLVRICLGNLSIKVVTKALFSDAIEPCKYCGK